VKENPNIAERFFSFLAILETRFPCATGSMCAHGFGLLKSSTYSQLKINHLKDTPSTKAAGGGIYSGVFLKDVKVPDQSRSQGGA
jgi:hypothetical protein